MKVQVLLFILLTFTSPMLCAQAESIIHRQPHVSLKNKMRSIILVAAPFLDEQVNVLDVFRWLEEETKHADPDGSGIVFELMFDDPRPLEDRNTLKKWEKGDYASATWPQIHRVTVEEYVVYLTKISGFSYSVTTDRILINNGVTRAGQ